MGVRLADKAGHGGAGDRRELSPQGRPGKGLCPRPSGSKPHPEPCYALPAERSRGNTMKGVWGRSCGGHVGLSGAAR